jgi:SAM-dependent methyltransferase
VTDDQQPVEDLLARLERERLEADRLYNAALTALDGTLRPMPTLPVEPRAYDASRLPDVNASWKTLPAGPPRFDSSVKGRLGRFVWRLIGPALEQQQQFNGAVADHLNRNVETHSESAAALASMIRTARGELEALVRFESILVQYLQTITAYVDTKDRSAGGAEIRQRLALTEQRLHALQREIAARPAAPAELAPPTEGDAAPPQTAFGGAVDSLTYVAFEDQFRGSRQDIRRRVEDYVPIFAGATNVVDIGCGRGELLDALRAAGVRARGVDVSPAMVEICRGRGFDVELGDALGFLSKQPDGSLGGLVAVQVVEHFTPAYLVRFLEAACHALAPGAPIVLETINLCCWMAFFETYLRDLTHQQPLHPETLRHLVQSSGFSHVDVQFRAPVPDDDRLTQISLADPLIAPVVMPLVHAINDHAQKLNRRLFSSMDYVVIGRK